jgi:AAA domain
VFYTHSALSRIRLSRVSLTIEQILAQAQDVTQESAHSWFVTCPAHKGGQEDRPSLHVTQQPDHSVIFHCFAGCSYAQIVEAFQGFKPVEAAKNGHKNGNGSGGPLKISAIGMTPIEWLAAYTSLSQEFLATQSIDFSHRGKIGFVFPHSKAVKWREVKSAAKGQWEVHEDNPPPLWPELPTTLPEAVFLTAGETDCLCLRATGVEAFALTKGEMGLPPAHLFRDMMRRGAREVIYTADVDEVGKQAAGLLSHLVEDVGLACTLLDLTDHLDAALGEKDVRALTRRVGVLELRELLEAEYLRPPELPVSMAEFIAGAPPEIPWLMMPLIVRGATTLFSGHAKAGKTTFIVKVMLAMRDGGDILGMPVHQGRVLVWTENSKTVWRAKLNNVKMEQIDHIFPIPRTDPRFLGKTFDESIRTVFEVATQLECSLIVLDTLTGLAAIEEENEASQVSAALIPVSKMAQRHQIACLMVHHLGRSGQERGSTVFLSEPDILVRLDGEYAEERTLRVKNNMLINPPEDLVFMMDSTGNYAVGVAGVTDDNALAILDVLPLVQSEALSLQDIASAMQMTWDKSTRDALALQVANLEKAGRIRRLSKGAGLPALHYRVSRFSTRIKR